MLSIWPASSHASFKCIKLCIVLLHAIKSDLILSKYDLCLFLFPTPQVTEQGLHLDHLDTAQATGDGSVPYSDHNRNNNTHIHYDCLPAWMIYCNIWGSHSRIVRLQSNKNATSEKIFGYCAGAVQSVTGHLTSLQLNSLISISMLSFYIINNLQSVHLPNDLHTKSIYIMSPQTKLHVQPTITSFITVT